MSESLAFCTANSPGSLSNKKYALLENTVSSDHRLAAFGSRSRMSTLEARSREENCWKIYHRERKKRMKFIAQMILINFLKAFEKLIWKNVRRNKVVQVIASNVSGSSLRCSRSMTFYYKWSSEHDRSLQSTSCSEISPLRLKISLILSLGIQEGKIWFSSRKDEQTPMTLQVDVYGTEGLRWR